MELKPDGWFGYYYAQLLHEYGRWDEAMKVLDGPIPASMADRAESLKAVIAGPYKKKYPRAWK